VGEEAEVIFKEFKNSRISIVEEMKMRNDGGQN
jgi:hypothetical protein